MGHQWPPALVNQRPSRQNQSIDLEKAFDSIPHELIWQSMPAHGIPEAYIKCVQLMYTDITSQVRSTVGLSEPFNGKVGVHKGSALSPYVGRGKILGGGFAYTYML